MNMEQAKQKLLNNPPNELVKAAENVFFAMTHVSIVKPIVEAYQQKILEYEKYPYAEKEHERRGVTFDDYIKDAKFSYLMSDQDAQHFYKRCNEEREKSGLHVSDPEFCPLLVAENLLIKAHRVLTNLMEPITDVSFDQLICAGLDTLHEYEELTLKLLAPHCNTKRAMGNIKRLTA